MRKLYILVLVLLAAGVAAAAQDISSQESRKARLEREIEKQEKVIADLDVKIEAAAADYQELTRLLGEKEEAELVLMDLMEQWETAQEN
jgi:hypothetical protein